MEPDATNRPLRVRMPQLRPKVAVLGKLEDAWLILLDLVATTFNPGCVVPPELDDRRLTL
jgi:hypothetical protein